MQNFELTNVVAVLGPWEIAGIVFVAVLLFGSKKLPQLARSAGRSLNEFKRGKADIEKEIKEGAAEANGDADVADAKTEVKKEQEVS